LQGLVSGCSVDAPARQIQHAASSSELMDALLEKNYKRELINGGKK
jgi:hypothetical protein